MESQEILKTRSGLAIQRGPQTLKPKPEPRSAAKTPSKPKRTKKDRMKSDKVARLHKPLSQLTKDWKSDVIDIDAYVNRSAEVRRSEINEGKNPGKIKRPMNSFMLYRKAYQHRTKDWCLQNNHQVVSQVCGDSWPLEPEEVKEQFNEWARIERINHQKAHPDYKFTPSKPGMGKASSKRKSGSPESDESDLEDFDWQGRTRRSKKTRQPVVVAPETPQPVAYPTTRSAYHYDSREDSMEPGYVSYHPSSYQISNGGRYATQYDPNSLDQGHYYQPYVRDHTPMSGVEDVMYRKAARPHPYGAQQEQEYEPVHVQQQYSHPAQIDPSLLSHGLHQYAEYSTPQIDPNFFVMPNPDDQQWAQYGVLDQDFNHGITYLAVDPALDGSQIQDAHMDILKGNQDGWQVDTLDAGDDFDKWMNEA